MVKAKRTYLQLNLARLFFFLIFIGSCFETNAQIFPDSSPETEEVLPEFPEDSLGRRNPRGTVSGFISSLSRQNYNRAARYLNLKEISIGNGEPERLVKTFQSLLDRGGNIMPYAWINDDYEGRADDDLPPEIDRVGSVNVGGENIDLYVERTLGPDNAPVWLFSSSTVNTIAQIEPEDQSLLERFLPAYLKSKLWGGVPIGQWLAAVLIAALAIFLAWAIIAFFIFIIKLIWKKAKNEPLSGIIRALSVPFQLYLAVLLFLILSQEAGLSIILRQRFSGVVMIIVVIAFLLLLWRLSDFIGNFSKSKMAEKGNFSGVSVILFLQRAAKLAIIIFGGITILLNLGYDVTTGLAALGIGGLALALGAQKTIENFVGSVSLITDQPVRVGDFCKVGTTTGTVEKIGMRSTRIRTNNRTVVTIPNGQFSSETIENYAHRDRFLFNPVIDLRYETSPDQIRYLLQEIRTILYSHPLVSPDPARVRLGELGEFSIKIEIFSYIDTKAFDTYMEVKEDLLLRIMDVVTESGSDFAFPSQTLYLSKDQGLSKDKSANAEQMVKKWKENNEMQIPAFDEEKKESLKNTIEYPPPGSVKHKGKGEQLF